MMSEYPYCSDCLVEFKDHYGKVFWFDLAENCNNCDDLIGATENGRLYRNNRPGREQVLFSEMKKPERMVARYVNGIEYMAPEVENTVAYLQKYSDEEKKAIRKAFKSLDLPQATGPGDVGKVGTEIAVAADVVPTPFVNYKRPVASPKMVVEVPFETETGVVMPPLPRHECELPKAVETESDEWESKKKTDHVRIKDGSVFTCACGKNWFVRVHKVPYHISDYDPQYIYSWKPIRWFNFGRIMDLRNRKEQ